MQDGIGGKHLFHDRREEGRRHAPYHPRPLVPGDTYKQGGVLGVWAKTLLPTAEDFDPHNIKGEPRVPWVEEEGHDPHPPGWS
jgi:hypothetical protein